DEADALDYETGDIVGRTHSSFDNAGSDGGGASAADLCHRIEAGLGFKLGTEKLKASGGISSFDGEATIMGTRLDWQCGLSEQLTWGAFISRHFFSLKQKQT